MGARYQIDLSRHRSRQVSAAILSQADLILVMQSGHKEALLSEFPVHQGHVQLLSEVTEGRAYDIPDAFTSENEMAELVSEIDALLTLGMDSICVLAADLNHARHRHDR